MQKQQQQQQKPLCGHLFMWEAAAGSRWLGNAGWKRSIYGAAAVHTGESAAPPHLCPAVLHSSRPV